LFATLYKISGQSESLAVFNSRTVNTSTARATVTRAVVRILRIL